MVNGQYIQWNNCHNKEIMKALINYFLNYCGDKFKADNRENHSGQRTGGYSYGVNVTNKQSTYYNKLIPKIKTQTIKT